MKKQFFFILSIILILAIIFSGCGENSSTGPSPSPTGSPTETPTPTPTQTPIPTLPAPFSPMIRVPGVTSFPTGIDDSGVCTTVKYPYYVAQTEVTYQQWSIVYNWAVSNGYTFANAGSRGGYYNTGTQLTGVFTSGHDTDPVTTISWRDAIVWCNALTEYYNSLNGTSLSCVYKLVGTPIRNANNTTCDTVVPDTSSKGFRLPLSMEWELAARYKDGTSWTSGSYASGAIANYTNAAANSAVAWYSLNSNLSAANIYSTQPVSGKIANALNLRDMSGNVWEWCFDISGSDRLLRGGSWYHPNTKLQLGYIYTQSSATVTLNDAGFRFVRTE